MPIYGEPINFTNFLLIAFGVLINSYKRFNVYKTIKTINLSYRRKINALEQLETTAKTVLNHERRYDLELTHLGSADTFLDRLTQCVA